MAYLHNDVYDDGLNTLTNDGNAIWLLAAETTDYATANTNKLATKTSPTISAPGNRSGGGREVTVSAFTDGTVAAEGTGSYWHIVDTVNSKVLAIDAVTNPQTLYVGNPWSGGSFKIGIPGPV